ncbi:MAG: hypothetical protein CEE38_12630 [Planctomycetes bacterium B3_Pla]|nr:MAG: hypothetical protein CEE38_12630 [Planctomycetes bacterium B3_Pla]
MKAKIVITILVGLLVLLAVAPAIPAGGKAAEKAQGAADKDAKGPPEIETVTFVNIPYWSSPPWYPDECDENADTYRLVMGGIRWADDNPQVACVVYTLGAPTGAFAAVTPAFVTWDGATTAGIYGSISENAVNPPPGIAADETNTISWGTIDGPGGTIAMTSFSFWPHTKELVEFDLIFDKDEDWTTTGFDIQGVATHELGHTLVLDDLRSPRDGALTMHAYTWPGDTWKQTLGSGDIRGIRAIYGE